MIKMKDMLYSSMYISTTTTAAAAPAATTAIINQLNFNFNKVNLTFHIVNL